MGNVITVRGTGFDYWATYVGGKKIKTDGLKQHTQTNVIRYALMTYLSVNKILKIKSSN